MAYKGVMPGLVPGIHDQSGLTSPTNGREEPIRVFSRYRAFVDGRIKSGHDEFFIIGDCGHQSAAMTLFVKVPRPVISTSHTSPTLSRLLVPGIEPGVPIAQTSPGRIS